jgi:RNA polymerase sigma factor (TIGR02999 family)
MKGERPDHTLQPTALVNEAYLCLIDQTSVRWQNRAHFLAIAARTMRHILVDHARRHHAVKRGGGERKLALDETIGSPDHQSVDLIALDRALDVLAAVDPDRSRLVELRFFGGLTIEESAEVLEVSPATVKRMWAMAKAWLFREIRGSSSG